jgi:hypothetical protein
MIDGNTMYVKASHWKTGVLSLNTKLETGSDSRFGGPYGE